VLLQDETVGVHGHLSADTTSTIGNGTATLCRRSIRIDSRGLGDTLAPRALAESDRFPPKPPHRAFAEPLYDTFAFISRRGAHLSPGTREIISMIDRRVGRD
jgi:hypothetical protein